MTKEAFYDFVRKTVFELKAYAEAAKKQELPYDFEFRWSGKENTTVVGIENVIDEIVKHVYISPTEIYPCVDLIVQEVTASNRILVRGTIAGYDPKPIETGWSGRFGPFIYGV